MEGPAGIGQAIMTGRHEACTALFAVDYYELFLGICHHFIKLRLYSDNRALIPKSKAAGSAFT